jgi:hypothetical protein
VAGELVAGIPIDEVSRYVLGYMEALRRKCVQHVCEEYVRLYVDSLHGQH